MCVRGGRGGRQILGRVGVYATKGKEGEKGEIGKVEGRGREAKGVIISKDLKRRNTGKDVA